MLDFIAIGLGPFNLSLASLMHEKSDLSYLLFEKKAQFDWHAGMQLPNTVLQVPFMADLVSMVDPTSQFSFLNYLKHFQRLYKFYFLEQAHIPRREYNHYCQWVADQISNIQYSSTVLSIKARDIGFHVVVEQGGVIHNYECRNLVLGTGNFPHLPDCLKELHINCPDQCFHSADYLNRTLKSSEDVVTVIGSGQSAAEVFLDLFDRQYDFDQKHTPQFSLNWFTRSDGFFPMEYAPLGLEHFSPDYLKYFYHLEKADKKNLLTRQSLLHKGISAQTIKDIYRKLYHRSIAQNKLDTHLHIQSELIDAKNIDQQKIRLFFKHKVDGHQFYLDTDFVVAATGYTTPKFNFMKDLSSYIQNDEYGHWQIDEQYRLNHSAHGNIFVQNQEFHSHGVVTPDLGMGAYRAAKIANQLLGYEHYEFTDDAQCYQNFNSNQNENLHHITSVKKESDTALQKNNLFDSQQTKSEYLSRPSRTVKQAEPQKAPYERIL